MLEIFLLESTIHLKLINNQKTYEVFNNIIDWYPKSKKIYVSDEKKYLEKMHYFYDKGDYSASIKFANSIFESTKNKKLRDEILGFLCNSFISSGRTIMQIKL